MNFNEASNTELFRLFVEQNSKEAISQFFQNLTDLFYRVALKYTRNTADAEDVIQSSFITIIDKASQYNGIKSDEEKLLRSWCLSIVVQCALMKIRSESSRRNREYKFSSISQKTREEEKNMEQEIENKDVHQKIQNAIVQLPEKYRIPIHLKYIEGLELDEISNILKLNANTLRSIIKRGLEKISIQLNEENITLTSVGLIGIIESLPVEKAPLSLKSLASKVINLPRDANIIALNTKVSQSISGFKIVMASVLCSLAIGIGFYVYKNNGSIDAQINTANTKVADTNQVWDFTKEKDRNITLLYGEWLWNNEAKAMVTRINTYLIISLPIKPQTKPFVVEYLIAPYITSETPETELFFADGWVRGNEIIENEYFKTNKNFSSENLKFDTVKIYYFKNHVYLIAKDKCIGINKYVDSLKEANVYLMTKNYIFRKITSHTFENPPDELLRAMEINMQGKGETRVNIKIDPANIKEYEPKAGIK